MNGTDEGRERGAAADVAAYRDATRRALSEMAAALAVEPINCLECVDAAERSIVVLRDRLIADLRQRPPDAQAGSLRAALEQTNMALSCIVGVEYPGTGSQRPLLEMAHSTLLGLEWS